MTPSTPEQCATVANFFNGPMTKEEILFVLTFLCERLNEMGERAAENRLIEAAGVLNGRTPRKPMSRVVEIPTRCM